MGSWVCVVWLLLVAKDGASQVTTESTESGQVQRCPPMSFCIARINCPKDTNIVYDAKSVIQGPREQFACGTLDTLDFVCCRITQQQVIQGGVQARQFFGGQMQTNMAGSNSLMVQPIRPGNQMVRRQISMPMGGDMNQQGFQPMDSFQRPVVQQGQHRMGRQLEFQQQPQFFDMFGQPTQPMGMNGPQMQPNQQQFVNRQQKGFAAPGQSFQRLDQFQPPQQQFPDRQFQQQQPDQFNQFSQQPQFPGQFSQQPQQFPGQFQDSQQFPGQQSQSFQQFPGQQPPGFQQFPGQQPQNFQQFQGQPPESFPGQQQFQPRPPFQQPILDRQDFTRFPECGMTLTPINNTGEQSDKTGFGDMPWMAAIFLRDRSLDATDNSSASTRGWVFKCSAVLIHPQLLLTTASCVFPAPSVETRVRLGDSNINSMQEPFPAIDRRITNVFIHEEFNDPQPGSNDLAIVELDSPVLPSISPAINTICLTREVVEWKNSQCVNAGWNYTASNSTPNEDASLRKSRVQLEWGSGSTCSERLKQKQIQWVQGTHCMVLTNSTTCLSDRGSGIFCKAPPISNPQGVMLSKYFLAAVAVQPPSCPSDAEPTGLAEETFPHMGWVLNVLSLFPRYPNVQPVTVSDTVLQQQFSREADRFVDGPQSGF